VGRIDAYFATDRTIAAVERLSRAKEILQQYGDYDWLTEQGSFVVLNNGVEFAVTYAIMLLMLFFVGGGRYLSLDYWIAKKFRSQAFIYKTKPNARQNQAIKIQHQQAQFRLLIQP
jgi:hypothetical protein